MKEEAARELFDSRFLPAFKLHYPSMADTEFFVDPDSMEIDGGGSPGLVLLTKGACEQADYLVKFAIAHETAHGVVFLECEKQGVNCPNPEGITRKKHEAWADLIATKVLITQLPEFWALVAANLDLLVSVLGIDTGSHPSGKVRVKLIREYASAYDQASVPVSKGFLRTIFCCGSSKPNNPVQRREKAFNACFAKIYTTTL
ncbi:MAG: hypothetical protein AAAB16_15630 [Pseudomonas sp.]|uniref:hypothetical protein n=1 Tax=Pseudomonas sp. TaxID=306 RepID=UPI000D8E10B2